MFQKYGSNFCVVLADRQERHRFNQMKLPAAPITTEKKKKITAVFFFNGRGNILMSSYNGILFYNFAGWTCPVQKRDLSEYGRQWQLLRRVATEQERRRIQMLPTMQR